MIKALAGEEIVKKVGGRFKLTALIQHRMRELMEGARPLVERQGRSDLEVAIAEIAEDKIELEFVEEEETEDILSGSPF
ncbi:MAG: DNA-directed RNA polymerase subunit omega [Phycisphaeraceae bacterium]|nr:DNA-directed RNA polymerase subunit omega [Phycisphaeraceae bacterium]